jgi:hypothetical protein
MHIKDYTFGHLTINLNCKNGLTDICTQNTTCYKLVGEMNQSPERLECCQRVAINR